MVSLPEIRAAAQTIAPHVHRTPLLSSRTLSQWAGAAVLLKAECFQKTGSFKVRGVFNKIGALSNEEKARGLIGISAGNHAQALAYGAAAAGVHCTVVMPAHASPTKVAASRGYGASVVLHGNVFEAFEKLEQLRAEYRYTLVHPFDDEIVIAGAGTVGLEVVGDARDVDVVLVPIGGGGLISGVAAAVKALRPDARVIGVEPEGAPTLTQALAAGEPVRLQQIDTIADGLSAPMAGEHTLEHIKTFVDDVVLVTDEDLRTALRFLLERCKLLVEPAGAAGIAAILSGIIALPEGARVVVVLSGGNMDLNRLKETL